MDQRYIANLHTLVYTVGRVTPQGVTLLGTCFLLNKLKSMITIGHNKSIRIKLLQRRCSVKSTLRVSSNRICRRLSYKRWLRPKNNCKNNRKGLSALSIWMKSTNKSDSSTHTKAQRESNNNNITLKDRLCTQLQ